MLLLPPLQSVAASSAVLEMGRAALEKMFGEEEGPVLHVYWRAFLLGGKLNFFCLAFQGINILIYFYSSTFR